MLLKLGLIRSQRIRQAVRRSISVAFIVAIAAIAVSPVVPVSAAVDLTSFSAQVQGATVLVTWRTATERGNTGFRLLRSTSTGGPWESKGEFHSTCPGCILGANYSFADNSVTSGKMYYYKLQSIDSGKQYGPVSVSFGATAASATATAIATATATATPSKTGTAATALSSSPAPTFRVASTATPRPGAATATRSASFNLTPMVTASPTLLETRPPRIAYAVKSTANPPSSPAAPDAVLTVSAPSVLPTDPSIAMAPENEDVQAEIDSSDSASSTDRWRPVFRFAVFALTGVLGLGAVVFASLSIYFFARTSRRG